MLRCSKANVLAALLILAMWGATSSAVADDAICDGEISEGILDNVIVPAGEVCQLRGPNSRGTVEVNGNVIVEPGGALRADGLVIGGNVESDSAAYIFLGSSCEVIGNVKITHTIAAPPYSTGLPPLNSVCNCMVGGSLTVENNVAPFDIGQAPTCTGGGISVGGNVKVFGNEAPVRISNNEIGGTLTCDSNTPLATGNPGSNSVSGNKEGECSGL